MIKRKCKIILLDEVNCIFVGLHPDHVIYFYELYGKFAKGYFFSPKFQLGSWDGKIRFFYKNGKTFVNLLKDIVPRVVGLKYEIEIEDRRVAKAVTPTLIDEDFFSHIDDPETGKPWKVRDYQVNMVNALMANAGGIGIAGTGGGKTSMCAALALSYERAANYRSIIVVPDTTLTDQTKEEYEMFELDVGDYCGTSKDLNHQHIVATWQTLQNNKTIISQFDMIIVDECFSADTDILLADGSTKKIIDINQGDIILSYNIKLQAYEKDIVIKRHENLSVSSEEDMYELTFDNNQTLCVTGNHKILTTEGYIRADALDNTHNIVSILTE